MHFREDEKITVKELKERYFEISDLKPEEKENVEFLNPVSDKFVNPDSIVTLCAKDFEEKPLIVEQVERE